MVAELNSDPQEGRPVLLTSVPFDALILLPVAIVTSVTVALPRARPLINEALPEMER